MKIDREKSLRTLSQGRFETMVLSLQDYRLFLTASELLSRKIARSVMEKLEYFSNSFIQETLFFFSKLLQAILLELIPGVRKQNACPARRLYLWHCLFRNAICILYTLYAVLLSYPCRKSFFPHIHSWRRLMLTYAESI